MEGIQPFIYIERVLQPAPQDADPFLYLLPSAGKQPFHQSAEVTTPSFVEIGIGRVDIVGGNKFKNRTTKGQVGIMARQGVFEFLQPNVYKRLFEEAFAECKGMGMSKAAIFVGGMGEVFFIPGQEVEYGCEDVEGKVALRGEKSFLVFEGETLDCYWMDAGFKNNGGGRGEGGAGRRRKQPGMFCAE